MGRKEFTGVRYVRLKALWKLASSKNWFGRTGSSWKKPVFELDDFMAAYLGHYDLWQAVRTVERLED